MRIIIATNNSHKVEEIKSKIKNFEVLSLADLKINTEIEEFGITIEQNTLIKAQAIANLYPQDIIIADDTGLFIDKLPGELGVYSKRYAEDKAEYDNDPDSANRQKVLAKLNNEESKAYFQTTICMINPKVEEPILFTGKIEGKIITAEQGNTGFGYDSIFAVGKRTFAQIPLEEKNAISHRALALDKMLIYLSGLHV